MISFFDFILKVKTSQQYIYDCTFTMSSSDSLPLQPVDDSFVIPLRSDGSPRDDCCSQYFTVCGGCNGEPIELKLCNYNAICLTITPIFKWCKSERGCDFPPNVNASVAIFSSETICRCGDNLGWDFLVYPPSGAQALNVCAELIPYVPCPPCPCGCSSSKPCNGYLTSNTNNNNQSNGRRGRSNKRSHRHNN